MDGESESNGESKDDNTIPEGASLLAAQSMSAVQQRKRKTTNAPVLQRMRPMSKRKKFKKSLGPDFLEPSDFGMDYLRNSFEPKCDVCSRTSPSPEYDVHEELLYCNKCSAKAHPSCVNMSGERYTHIGHRSQWQCSHCNHCCICHVSVDNEFVLICITCNKGYHLKCQNVTIKKRGKWNCNSCLSKQNNSQNGVTDKRDCNSENNKSADCGTSLKIEDNEHVKGDQNELINDGISSDTSSDDTKDDESNSAQKNDNEFEVTSDYMHENKDENANNCKEDNKEEDNSDDNTNSPQTYESNATQSTNSCLGSPKKWTVDDVESFIRDAGFPEQAKVFKSQEIDGPSLLLLRRADVLTGLSLKLGPALKIYSHIIRLQGREQL